MTREEMIKQLKECVAGIQLQLSAFEKFDCEDFMKDFEYGFEAVDCLEELFFSLFESALALKYLAHTWEKIDEIE
jgi:hypothetical protein